MQFNLSLDIGSLLRQRTLERPTDFPAAQRQDICHVLATLSPQCHSGHLSEGACQYHTVHTVP